MPDAYDLAIVGGGIHGACIARDAAGRGLSVLLLERGDLGGATSSASSKLIHGGLRYLEHLDLRLVREALSEREILLATAPHLVRPLRFVLPIGPGTRPAWMVRFGLALYDRLSRRRTLPGSHALHLHASPFGAGLRPEFERGFLYSDARADDARLVLANARAAADLGAAIHPRTELVSAIRAPHGWTLLTQPRPAPNGALPLGIPRAPTRCTARALLDAAGPWTAQVLSDVIRVPPQRRLRLVKGSHVVVPRLYDGAHAYILQQPDRRVVFLIPWGATRTLLGTTEIVVDAPGPAHLDPAETDYLCAAAARFLRDAPTPRDVLWSYAGLRPLLDDGRASASAVTRDYALDLDTDGAPLLSAWGGKLTTCRRLAERAVDLLAPLLAAHRPAWTADAPLPGGALPPGADATLRRDAELAALRADFTGTAPDLLAALIDRHGALARALLDSAPSATAGAPAVPGLHAHELEWCVTREWAASADDILWRRSKCGLDAGPDLPVSLDAWLARRLAATSPEA